MFEGFHTLQQIAPNIEGQTYPKDAKWKRQYQDFDPKSLPKICNNISDKNSCWRTAYYNEVKNYNINIEY